MKLKFAHIENFKGVKEAHLDFQPPPEKRTTNLHAIVGDNGSGKTTVMQAIALTLSLATRKTRRMDEFAWYGFLPERIGTMGRTRVELGVEFSPEEVRLNRQLSTCGCAYNRQNGFKPTELRSRDNSRT